MNGVNPLVGQFQINYTTINDFEESAAGDSSKLGIGGDKTSGDDLNHFHFTRRIALTFPSYWYA
jgi:hypothetical protein